MTLPTLLFGGGCAALGAAARDCFVRWRRSRHHPYPTRLPYDDRVIKRIDAQVGDLVRQRRLDESHASAITPVLHRLVRLQSDVPGPR